jgi:hypothetical protein
MHGRVPQRIPSFPRWGACSIWACSIWRQGSLQMKNRSGDTHNRLKPPISLQAQPPSNDCQFNPFLPILPLSVIGPSHLVPYPLYTYICISHMFILMIMPLWNFTASQDTMTVTYSEARSDKRLFLTWLDRH